MVHRYLIGCLTAILFTVGSLTSTAAAKITQLKIDIPAEQPIVNGRRTSKIITDTGAILRVMGWYSKKGKLEKMVIDFDDTKTWIKLQTGETVSRQASIRDTQGNTFLIKTTYKLWNDGNYRLVQLNFDPTFTPPTGTTKLISQIKTLEGLILVIKTTWQ